MNTTKSKAKFIIKGRVQGVCYRHNTRITAAAFGLSGWVRNLSDGSVEACALGDRDKIEQLIVWLRVGPPGARVDSVEINWQEQDALDEPYIERGFDIR